MDVINGTSLTALTVKINDSESLYSPSVILTDIIISPCQLILGDTMSVLPSILISAFVVSASTEYVIESSSGSKTSIV